MRALLPANGKPQPYCEITRTVPGICLLIKILLKLVDATQKFDLQRTEKPADGLIQKLVNYIKITFRPRDY